MNDVFAFAALRDRWCNDEAANGVCGEFDATFARAGSPDYDATPSFKENPSETSGSLRQDLPVQSSPSSLCFLGDETDSLNDSGIEDYLSCSFEDSDSSDEEDNDEEHTGWQDYGAFKLAVATWTRHGRQPTDSNAIAHLGKNNFRKASSEKPDDQEGSSSGGSEGSSSGSGSGSGSDSGSGSGSGSDSGSGSGSGSNGSPRPVENAASESPPTDNLHDQPVQNPNPQPQQNPPLRRLVPSPVPDAHIYLALQIINLRTTYVVQHVAGLMRNNPAAPNNPDMARAMEILRTGRPVPDLGACGPAAFAILSALDTVTRSIDNIARGRPDTPDSENGDDAAEPKLSPEEQFKMDDSTMGGPPSKRWKKDDDEDQGAGGQSTCC